MDSRAQRYRESEKVVRLEDTFERSRGRFESLAGDIGLETPKEVAA